MVYFIFEALYCRFFFFFHFNEALIALHLEITFVLLSSSFSPFLLLIIRFFLSPVIVTPKRYYLLFLRSSIIFFFLSFQVWMQRSPSFISVVRNSALRSRIFSSPFSSLFLSLVYLIRPRETRLLPVLERSISRFRRGHASR